MQSKQNFVLESGIVLTVATTMLFAVSVAWTGGFNNTFGLNADVLERNFQQVLYDGFVHIFSDVIKFSFWLLMILLARSLYSHAIQNSICVRAAQYLRRKMPFFFAKPKRNQLPATVVDADKHSVYVVGFWVFLFSLLTLLWQQEKAGKSEADELLQQLAQQSVPAHKSVTVSINNQALELVLLSCGARNCAAVEPKTRRVHYFSQSNFSHPLPIPPTQPAARK